MNIITEIIYLLIYSLDIFPPLESVCSNILLLKYTCVCV
jgi:hypothetical protein